MCKTRTLGSNPSISAIFFPPRESSREFSMKSGKILLIGCLVFPLILIVAFGIGFCSSAGKFGTGLSTSYKSWLVLDPAGIVSDYSEVQSSGFFGSGSSSSEELIAKIKTAADDKRIKGMLIKPGFLQINYANLGEIATAIAQFKGGKKTVVAYGDMMSQKDYLLCAMADSVWMEPSSSAGLMLEGVSANLMFYKEALQKLGIKMHVMQSGEFKGAGEPYTRTELSPGTRENIDKVLKARYDKLISDIASYRNIDSLAVKKVLEERDDLFISAATAKDFGLIDKAGSLDELKARYGITKNNSVSIKDYRASQAQVRSQKVAVVNLSGNITPGSDYGTETIISASKVRKVIEAIEKDKAIKAVVLRVNSPGGSALESELIYQQIKALGKKLPVVVSMGGVAASGGYYISCAGQYIYADPYTVTGSIGVIMTIPETKELGTKLGLRSQTLRHGKFAGAFNLFESYDPALLESFRRSSSAVYQEFQQRVSSSRQIPLDQMPQVAEGRVWSASDALSLKLIDAVGGLDDAIMKAAALARIDDYSITQYPTRVPIWQAIRDSGIFQMLSAQLRLRSSDPAEQLKSMLLSSFSPYEWLYRCPYSLD